MAGASTHLRWIEGRASSGRSRALTPLLLAASHGTLRQDVGLMALRRTAW